MRKDGLSLVLRKILPWSMAGGLVLLVVLFAYFGIFASLEASSPSQQSSMLVPAILIAVIAAFEPIGLAYLVAPRATGGSKRSVLYWMAGSMVISVLGFASYLYVFSFVMLPSARPLYLPNFLVVGFLMGVGAGGLVIAQTTIRERRRRS